MKIHVYALGAFLFLYGHVAEALDFNLAIQPILPKSEVLEVYQPLADYLSDETGHTIRIKSFHNFLTYWQSVKSTRDYDLALDAAHITAYRIKKSGFNVLAKLPDTVSFTLVTHEDNLVLDTDELIAKKVATMVSPSIGAIRLLSLFPDPMRQPRFVYALDSLDAAQQVINGEAVAAIIPTLLVSNFRELNPVLTTDSLPHMALSASANVPAQLRDSIRRALILARETVKGRAMLESLNFEGFDPSSNDDYLGYETLLKDMLGY